jgi:hypothetical protein
MRQSKKERKQALKEEKKVRSTVIEAFAGRDKQNAKKLQKANKADKKIDNVLIESLTHSVLLNKSMIKRDKDQTRKWQDSYYQQLFIEFKTLIDKYNGALQVKADALAEKVTSLKREKKQLQLDIQGLELKKEVLKNA